MSSPPCRDDTPPLKAFSTRRAKVRRSRGTQTTPSNSPREAIQAGSVPPDARDDDTDCMSDASSGPNRHVDLWFKDGSVVLATETVLFKVHQTLLSRHSAFFRDLFSLPQPADVKSASGVETDEETLEGCPVLHLQDNPEDVVVLLGAMYDGINFGNNDADDFRIVAGILRLTSKYLIDSLRNKALSHLHVAWPRTLKGWDLREDARQSYEMTHGKPLYPSPIAVINLAREIDEPSLLPSAFYDLSRASLIEIFDPPAPTAPSSPPTSPVSPTAPDSHTRNFPSSRPLTLSLHDTQNLVLGKEAAHNAIIALIQAMNAPVSSNALTHAQTLALATGTANAHTFGITHSPNLNLSHGHGGHGHGHGLGSHPRARTCMSAAACRKDFSELVELATQHYLFDKERGSSDPLYVAEELGQLKSAEFSECKACAASLEVWAARERERMWKLLPLWFRLDS